MKRFLKSSFSIFLALTIVFGSAIVGLNEIDFSEIKFVNTFAVESKAVSSGTCGDNLTWTLDDEGTLTISGTGDMKNFTYYYDEYAPWYSVRSSIINVIINNGVTTIGTSTFYGCKNLASITIPEGVIRIGNNAFYGCTKLTSITIPNSLTSIGWDAFSGCTSLKSVYIDDIAAWCAIDFAEYSNPLYYAKNLYIKGELGKDVVIPDTVTKIDDYAFNNCTSLTSIIIPDSVTSIGDSAFKGCASLTSVTIDSGRIGDYAFSNCTSLESVKIGKGVISIGENAFYNCTSLKSVYIDDIAAWCNINFSKSYDDYNEECLLANSNPLYVAENVYINGALVKDLVIPDGVRKIGELAFSGCTSLTSITIPESVTSIGEYAFWGCNAEIFIDDDNPTLSCDGKAIFNKDKTMLLCYLGANTDTHYTIPDGVKSIGKCAFCDCTSLESISIPKSVTSIGINAFNGSKSLKSVYIDDIAAWCKISFERGYHDDGDASYYYYGYSNPLYYADNLYVNGILTKDIVIPDGVTCISDYAFYSFGGLNTITIPDSVNSIGSSAFRSCGALTLTIGNGVTYIPEGAFQYCSRLRTVTIGNGVTSIGYSAFRSCSSLESLTIGKGVKSIGGYAFSGCTSLKSVYIDDIAAWCEISFARNYDWDYIQDSFGYSNPLYYAKNLYVKGELAKDIVIPAGVTSISEYAFWGYDITSIRIPVSVTRVGYCAFWCNVGHVYYEGTNEQWKKISFANGNGDLRKATRTKPQCTKPKLKKVTNMKSGVKITWSKVEFADSFRVYRKVKDGKWKYLDTTKNTYFTDKTAKSGTKYYYSVCAKNNAGVSDRSSSLSIKRLSVPKLSSVANTSSGIKVSWKKVTGASSYIVYRKTKGGKWDAIKKTSKLYYTDTKAKGGKTYIYTVRACSGSERSYYDTDGLSIRRLRSPEISSAASKREGILLKWNKITGASGYYVYRKTSSGDWKKIATVKGNTKIKYLDETPRKGVTYQYRVKAYYGKSTSYKSNTYKVKSKY